MKIYVTLGVVFLAVVVIKVAEFITMRSKRVDRKKNKDGKV